MEDIASTVVRIHFSGVDLDPASVSDLLKASPTHSNMRGDTVGRRARVMEEGGWTLESTIAGPIDDQIEALFESTSQNLLIWSQLAERYSGALEITMRAPLLNEAAFISPVVVQAIADRHLEIAFDVWNEHN